MKCKRSERINVKVKKQHRSKIAYWTITLMHDNPLLGLLKDPVRKLRSAGLEEGQKVLEVGCGPGFYTIPAARIVGSEGHVFALDLHPGFIEKVREKAKREELSNISATVCNASDTSLPAGSMDLTFLFGLGHIAGGLDSLLLEMRRVLKEDGILSFEGHGRTKPAIKSIEKAGFQFVETRDRIMIFKRI
ncbi:MAG TPA: class I SAM-dependent methyltransferase [Synergistales bacterium]|nr:class I SAM-dependent methyltransferase [Synergistales bacterium]